MQTIKMAERKRKQNWSVDETNVLADKCIGNIELINGKLCKDISVSDKKEFWMNTCVMVNACGGNERSVPEIMKKWADIKSKAKLAEQKRRGYMRKTGGGPPPAKLSSLDEKLVSVFPKEVLEGVAFGEDSFVPENSSVMTNVDPVEEEEVELAMPSTSEEDKENDAIDVSQVHKVRKRSKNSDDGCSELLVIEKQILQESRRRNDLLENIASKMDTIIDLKKKKIDLLEKQYSIQNASIINDMFFES